MRFVESIRSALGIGTQHEAPPAPPATPPYEGPLRAGQVFALRSAPHQHLRIVTVVYSDPRVVEYVLHSEGGECMTCWTDEQRFRGMVVAA